MTSHPDFEIKKVALFYMQFIGFVKGFFRNSDNGEEVEGDFRGGRREQLPYLPGFEIILNPRF